MARDADRGTILVVGDVMLDIVVTPERPIDLATDTPAAITLLPGGSAANVAAWLGHFGSHVRFAGRAGRDTAEQHAIALRAHAVEPMLGCDRDVPTGTAVTLIGANGERSFLTDRAANTRLARTDLPDTLLAGVSLVHVSGYVLLLPGPRAAVHELLRAAGERGIPHSVDAGSAGFLRDVGPTNFFRWTVDAAMCFANAAEAAVLAQSPDRARQLGQLGARYATAIVTCGPAGACAATDGGGRHWFADAASVAAIDTTGAGDAFVAAFLRAHVAGEAIDACLQAGVRAGTSAVRRAGGRPPARIGGASATPEI